MDGDVPLVTYLKDFSSFRRGVRIISFVFPTYGLVILA